MSESAGGRGGGWHRCGALAFGLVACDIPLPTPALTLDPAVAPSTVCNASNEANRSRQTRVTLHPAAGSAFFLAATISLDGVTAAIPAVSLRDAAGREVAMRSVELATPAEMALWITATTDAGRPLAPGDYTVLVRDAADRVASTARGALHVVAPPEIAGIERVEGSDAAPPIVCAQGASRLRVRGRGFRADAMAVALVGGGDAPPIAFDRVEVTVPSAEVMELTFNGRAPVGRYGLRVTSLDGSRNPMMPATLTASPQGCEATVPDVVEVVPNPALTSVEGGELCSAGAVRIVVRGESLRERDAFTLGEGSIAPDDVALDLPAGDGSFRRATLTVAASRLRGLSPYPIAVRSRGGCRATVGAACPAGTALDAEGRCARTEGERVLTTRPAATVVEAPRVDSVVAPRVCAAGPYAVMVRGANFFERLDEAPRLTLGGLDARYVPTPTTSTLVGEFEAPEDWLRDGAPRGLRVATPAGCIGEAHVTVPVFTATFDEVLPTSACRGADPLRLTLRGRGLGGAEGETRPVEVGGLAAQARRVSADALEVTVPPAAPVGVALDVVVGPRDGCELRRGGVVIDAPMQVVHTFALRACEGGGVSAIVRGENISASPPEVALDGEPLRPADVTRASPRAMRVALPSEPSPGAHTLTWRASNGCGEGASRVVWSAPERDAALATVTPAVVSRAAPGRVRLQGPYVGAFRSFSLVGAGAAGEALPLTEVEAIDADTVLATVPPGAAAGGPYAIEAAEGPCRATLPGALTVVAAGGVSIDTLAPATVERASSARVTVVGEGWTTPPRLYLSRDGAVVEVTPVALRPGRVAFDAPPTLAEGTYALALAAQDGRGAVVPGALRVVARAPRITAITSTAVGPGRFELVALGDGFDDPRVSLVFPGGGLTATVVRASRRHVVAHFEEALLPDGRWTVRVTNRDGGFVDGPRLRLRRGSPATCTTAGAAPLSAPRRGPGAVSYETRDGAHHLLAIGGDGGVGAPARADVERATLERDEGVGPWQVERHRLPAPRASVAHAAFVHAGHVYLIGGSDGEGRPVDTVLRAAILDPERRPVARAEAVTASGAGLAPGVWLYRVAAVLGDGAADPGEETVASEAVAARCDARCAVRLRWTPVAGALRYRVYRTREADRDAREIAPFASLDALTWEDDGSVDAEAAGWSDRPLDPGAVGPWRTLDLRLNAARSGAAVTLARGADGRQTLLVFGGRGAQLRDDVERSVWDEARGAFGAFAVDAHRLLRAQEDAVAAVATQDDVPWLVSPARVYVTGGRDAEGAVAPSETAAVLDEGALAAWREVARHTRSNPSAFAMGGDLVTFGGTAPDAALGGTMCRARLDAYGRAPGFVCGEGGLRDPWRSGGAARAGELVYLVGGVTAGDLASDLVARCAP